MGKVSDEFILRLMKKDSQSGMDLLIETYGSLAAFIIRRKISSVCSEADVEECAADTFVDLYNGIDRVDLKKGSLKSYISVIARRRAADRFNAAVRELDRMTDADESRFHIIPDDSPGPEETVMTEEKGACLLDEVKRLGEPDSEILFRRYYLEQPLEEIAEALGMKRPAVSKRISRALDKLRVSLEGNI